MLPSRVSQMGREVPRLSLGRRAETGVRVTSGEMQVYEGLVAHLICNSWPLGRLGYRHFTEVGRPVSRAPTRSMRPRAAFRPPP